MLKKVSKQKLEMESLLDEVNESGNPYPEILLKDYNRTKQKSNHFSVNQQ